MTAQKCLVSELDFFQISISCCFNFIYLYDAKGYVT